VRDASADREGYFDVVVDLESPADPGDHVADVELLEPRGDEPVTARAAVLVPAATARYGVVSDIDDTVIRTDVKEFVRMARSVLLGNAHTRLPFPGVAAFYRALRDGPDGRSTNPLFYVSSSPWNLYELLEEMFTLRGIPAGPLMLRDWGLSSREGLPTQHSGHKLAAIRRLFDTYPTLSFVLIGDSGQEDPEIYASIIRQYPERVLAAYIRSVDRAPERLAALATLAKELADEGATLVVADDTLAAARHAAEKGWILPACVDRVAADVEDATPATE
jgi:phosphatidate phosphatase APP1